ncbi:basic helix-loop-helix domain-containing protein USF3 [Pelobates fuscus]|uniref:basic helix-loop-helix domain-containing protein USF3 n=1 Tax=Pelobates fuscus TaxID=191477 RepID=UPI002FE47557
MPEMTQNETSTKTRHRKKNRESHNEVERHRKKKINSGINRIGDLIPCSPALKQSKNMILEQAFKYITELKRQNDELLLNGGDKEQACEIKKLRKELAELQKENSRYIELLKSNDICLYDDPTLHWKGKARNSKTSLVASPDQVQKLPLCLNSSQLSSANQGSTVHGITFNVSQNLQKQTANVVPVQRTCNLVTPITISGVYPLENKTWQQSAVIASTSSQHIPLCLPVVTSAPNTNDVPASKGQPNVVFPVSSASVLSFLNGSTSQFQCSSSQTSQETNTGENMVAQPLVSLPNNASSTCSSLPSSLLPLVSEVSQASVSEISLQEHSNLLQGRYSGVTSCSETVKDVVQEIFPNIDIDSSPEVTVSSITSTLGNQAASATNLLTSSPLENSWSLPITLSSPELKNVSSLTRISSDGNTQTTWTTLQLAGNTIQPLSQTSSTVIPMLLTEQQTCSKDANSNKLIAASVNLNTSEGRSVEVMKIPPGLQVPAQMIHSQSQSAPNLLPLNPPVQVIQVAQPVRPALNPVPANQNIILLQPPAAAPCPPVLRTDVPKPGVGQQIVIIQASPNQTPLPIMSAQPAPSVVLPLNAGSHVVCPTNTVQNAVAPQTFGGKHLVHILPRPTPVPSTSPVQSVPVSTVSSNQQPPTISLNGHLFALQPVTLSTGTANQTPMQIIQPTTSEDPNTNVALNTFGALANLSQSISQMAGQSCLQFTLNPPAPSLTGANVPVNCIPVTGTSTAVVTTESTNSLPVTSSPTNLFPGKNAGGSPSNVKPKKTIKKPSTKKSSKKEISISNKSNSFGAESSNEQSNGDNLEQLESTSVLVNTTSTVQEKLDSVGNEVVTLEGLNSSGETCMLSNSVSGEPFSGEFAGCRDLLPSADVCLNQDDHITPSEPPESFKDCAVTTVSSILPTAQMQESSATKVSEDQTVLTTGTIADAVDVSKACVLQEDSSSLTATDLLEVQILADDPKGRSPSPKVATKEVLHSGLFYRKVKSKEVTSAEHAKEDPLLVNTPASHGTQHQPCVSVQEIVASGSCVTNRQTDSPLSTSSGSSRNFSVASMLPDVSREDVTSGTMTSSFNGCSFTEQNDIVAVAARVIFDQENLPKGRARIQTEVRSDVSRVADSEISAGDCRHPYKSHMAKENLAVHSTSSTFNSLDSSTHPGVSQLSEKTNCPVKINTNLSLQISTSQSQSMTSLSINNLIHQSGMNSNVNRANIAQTSTTSNTPATLSSTYKKQTQVSSASEFSQEQLHTIRATVMQVTRANDSTLKHGETRKESNKRCAQEDSLISAAKRQKQCQASVRHERLQAQENLSEQNVVLVSHVPSIPSSSLSSSNQGHGDGLATLFPSSSNFNTNLRQTEMRCSSQPAVSEQSQMGVQQLHSLQHTPNPISLLHSNQYLKQQQASHLREQHHHYQQQHHISHSDTTIHSQSHNVQQQQRLLQHDVQIQKKRGPVQGGQATRLSLQQDHHLSEQNRQKGGQQHPHHQQLPPHFGSSQVEKACDNNAPSRNHHGSHPPSHVSQEILHQHQQDVGSRQQGSVVSEHLSGHNQVQRLMTSRSLEQQMVSQASVVSRPTNMTCAPHRQERNRVSSYSAEALIGKSTSNSEQRMGITNQSSRLPDQLEMRKYLDISRNKGLSVHNLQGHMSIDHNVNTETGQRLPDCQTFKTASSSQQQSGVFEVQTSRNNDANAVTSMRGMQSQAYRINHNPNSSMDRQKHLPYQPMQDGQITNTLPNRDNENSCHQSFMQSLLAPHIGEQVSVSQRSISGHQRSQYNSSSGIEYTCPPPTRESVHLRRENDGPNRESCDLAMGQVTSRNNSLSIPFSSSSSSGDIQNRNTSPHPSLQKSAMRPPDSQGTKNHLNIQVSINMHGVVHPAVPHQPVSHGNVDQRQIVRQGNPPIAQRSRHPLQDEADSKVRQPERTRTGNQRHSNMFDPTLPHLPLAGPGAMILGRQQSVTEKRTGIVRFMPDSSQVTTDNPNPDQHSLTQNFGFPFIPEGTMNPPINTNPSFMPPVTQATATRTPALIPVDPQNTIPSFYPSYSPAHPSLANDLTIPYFPNQMFSNPSTEKSSSTSLNNRFGSILSPPRPVGFSQTTFPLLPDMTPMHMTNPSHLSNFNLTSLFPEIAAALPADGSAMSPLLPLSHSSNSDSSKQSSNRPAHNISHILGHDSSSTV